MGCLGDTEEGSGGPGGTPRVDAEGVLHRPVDEGVDLRRGVAADCLPRQVVLDHAERLRLQQRLLRFYEEPYKDGTLEVRTEWPWLRWPGPS